MSAGAGVRAYRARMGAAVAGAGFDPAIVTAVISALLSLFTNCFKPKPAGVRRRARRKVVVAVAILERLPEMSEEQAFQLADLNSATVDAASDEEVQAMIDDATLGNEHLFLSDVPATPVVPVA